MLRESHVKVCAIADDQVQQLRDLTRLRFECAQTAVGEKQRLISLLDLAFPEYQDPFSDLFGASSRAVLAEFPTAKQLAKVDLRRLTRLLRGKQPRVLRPSAGATAQRSRQELVGPEASS